MTQNTKKIVDIFHVQGEGKGNLGKKLKGNTSGNQKKISPEGITVGDKVQRENQKNF